MKKENTNGLLIPGGLLIGLGIGLIINKIAGALLIGLGIGFILMWFANSKKNKK